jgi:hypothetical protein
MSWSEKYKRSIDCDNPKGFSQRAHCQGRKKSLKEQLKSFKSVEQIAKKHRLSVSFIQKQLDMGEKIEHEHTKNHELAREIALQHLDEIPDYYTSLKKMESDAKKHHKKFNDVKEETSSGDEGLRDWFGKSRSSDGKSGWVQLGGKWSGKPCARQPGQTSTPKCGSSKMKRALSKDEEEAARIRKNRLDPNQPEKSGGAKPTNVRTEEMNLQEVKDKPGKSSGKKDACYHKVKSRYSVWPSAYASGALVKCRRVGADNWGTKSEEVQMQRYCPKCEKNETMEECKYGPKYWEMFSTPISLSSDAYDPNSPHPANEERDHEYSMARSELSTIVSAAKRLKKKMGKGEGNIEAWVQSKITKAADYLDSAADYVDSGEMKSENVSIEDVDGNHYADFIDIIKPEPLKPSKGIGSELIGEKCWDGYDQQGMKKKGKRLVPNCVKKEEYSNWRDELIISEKWEDKLKDMTPEQIENLKKSNPGAAEKIDSMRKQAKSATPKPVGSGSQLPSVPKSPATQNRGQNLRDPRAQDRMTAARRQGSQNVAAAQAKRAAKIAAKPSLLKTLSKVKNPRVAIPLAIAGGIYGLLSGPKKQQKEDYSNWRSDFGLTEDWQSANRKDGVDGLSQSTVDKYRKEHPGSKLQTAVTEKNPKGKRADRRSNFCSRMSGMKDKLTSAKTARDPDSRINKALRRWNCN